MPAGAFPSQCMPVTLIILCTYATNLQVPPEPAEIVARLDVCLCALAPSPFTATLTAHTRMCLLPQFIKYAAERNAVLSKFIPHLAFVHTNVAESRQPATSPWEAQRLVVIHAIQSIRAGEPITPPPS